MKPLRLAGLILMLLLFTFSCALYSPSGVETLRVNVPSVTITGDFLLNGSPFSGSIYQSGIIYLRDSDGTNYTELGSTAYGSYTLAIVPGTYDIIYTHQHGAEVPLNKDAVVTAGVTINSDQVVDVDVASVSVRPWFTLNGEAFPSSIYNSAKFYLQDSAGGEPIPLGDSYQANDPVVVMPGTYNVIYSHEHGSLVPQNRNAIVATEMTIDREQVLAIDVATVSLRSSYALNGEPFPASIYSSATFYLRNLASDDTVMLGHSYDDYNSTIVIPGVYDVIYAHELGTQVPLNQNSVIISEVSIYSSQALAIDVPAVSVAGEFSLNGESFPASIYESAEFYLQDSESDELILLGNSISAVTPVLVVEGAYDVVYRHLNGSSVPQNKQAVVQRDVTVNEDGQILAIDISAVNITGQFSLDGDAFSSSIYESADFFLRPADGEEMILLGSSHLQGTPISIVAGTYDVIYVHRNGSDVPQHKSKEVLSAMLLKSTQSLKVDVSTVSVRAVFSLNGEPFPASIYESADFYLADPASGDMIFLGSSYEEQSEAVSVIVGTYDVVYQIKYGEQLPQNTVSNLFATVLQ